MKRVLFTASFTSHEVDIPDRCPACSADLRASQALLESALVDYSTPSHIEHRDAAGMRVAPGRTGVVHVLVRDDEPQEGQDSHPTALMCTSCDFLFTPPAPQEQTP